MANLDSPFGLRPIRRLDNAPMNAAVQRCITASGDTVVLGIGDPVVQVAAGGVAAGNNGPNSGVVLPYVARAAATAAIYGVVVGIEPNRSNLSSMRRESGEERQLLVMVADNMTVYHVQEATGGSGVLANIGLNADIVVADATTAGVSQVEISGTQAAGTAQLRIINFADIEGNEVGAHCKWEVVINEAALANGTSGV